MKSVYLILSIFVSFNVFSQNPDDYITFTDKIDGITISITTPNTYEIVNDSDDNYKNYTVFLISQNPTKSLIKLTQIPIPLIMENELKNDEKKHLEVFTEKIG